MDVASVQSTISGKPSAGAPVAGRVLHSMHCILNTPRTHLHVCGEYIQ